MKALAPLEKRILVETTLARLKDQELLDAMAFGGIKWISVGIETLSVPMGKHGGRNLEDNLKRVIDNAHERGMLVQGNFICGLDSDGPESFDRIYEYYRGSDLDLVLTDLLTPYPNTEQYDRINREGPIIDRDSEHYDYRHLVYRPQKMTVDQLIDGFIQLYRGISDARFVFDKARRIYSNNGFTREATMMISYNLFNSFDARRKEKALRRNQGELAIGCRSPSARPEGPTLDGIPAS